MEKIPLIELRNMIKQGEEAKKEIERRFEVKWETIEMKRGDVNDSVLSTPTTGT